MTADLPYSTGAAVSAAPNRHRAPRARFVILSLLVVGLSPAPPAAAQLGGDAELCVARSGNPRLDIDTCSQAIRAGGLASASLATVYQMRGRAFLDYGLPELAARDYDAAIDLNPGSAEAFNGRGLALHRLGAYEAAIAAYGMALDLFPRYARAHRNRGMSHHFAGALDRAIADYGAAQRLQPTDPAAYALRGLSHFHRGDFAAAAADLSAALALQYPYDQGPLFLYLARTRVGQDGRADLAAAAAADAFAPPAWPAPLFDLFLGRAEPDAVLPAATSADPRQRAERRREARYFLGQHALIEDRPADAVAWFQAVVEADLPPSFDFLGARAELARLRP